MTGNPLSGHTAANETSMSGSGVFTDSLKDGQHITSPSLTNMLEGVHGNGIILEEDTAAGDSQRNTPEDLPGVCEQDTNPNRIRIVGGHAVLDGVLYKFAGGPGSSLLVDFKTTSQHARATYASNYLSAGEEALIVVYVSSDSASNNCITWEIGTAVTTASNTYPTTPSGFLSDPKSGLAVKQSVVLAVIRVVHSASGGDMNLSIAESNDKRIFIRPSPIYFTPVTTGAEVGAPSPTAVDLHTELDALHTDNGDFSASRLGGLWQSFGAQIASTTAGDSGKDVLYYSGKHEARFTRSVFDRVLTTAATSLTITSADANILILTTRSGACAISTSGAFPAGYVVEIKNQDTGDTATFAGETIAASGYGRFVCTVSHASTPTFVRLQ
tara:strand:- start:27 stop:1181 length:1155 start_codon:yes stop_codon:yes gene_type:complete